MESSFSPVEVAFGISAVGWDGAFDAACALGCVDVGDGVFGMETLIGRMLEVADVNDICVLLKAG